MKTVWKSNLLIIVISIFIGITIFEFILKLYGRYNHLSEQILILSDAIYEKPKSSVLKNEHPDLRIIVLNEYDSDGIRNHDEIETKNKKNIVGIFGDSHVENINIKDEFQFTTLLNKHFNEQNFVNYGVGGYSIDQIFIRYLTFSKHDIKNVYYVFSGNDAGSINSNNLVKFSNGDYELIKPKFRLLEKIIGKLNITYFLIDTYYIVRSKMYLKHTLVNIDNYPKKLAEKLYYKFLAEKESNKNNVDNIVLFNQILKTFQEIVNKNNASFHMIILPSEEENDAFERIVKDKDNFEIINLYKLSKKLSNDFNKDLKFKNDSHFNEYGNLIIFELMKNYFSNQNKNQNIIPEYKIEKKIETLYN